MPAATVSRIVDKYKDNKTALISILQDIQEQYNYLPAEALKALAHKLNLKLIDVYAVATFYKSLRLAPQGKHNITVCTGTACHVRQAAKIMDEVQSRLGIAAGQTSPDSKFTFNTVNCLGACAIGPVMVVDGKYYGKMTPAKARKLLEGLK